MLKALKILLCIITIVPVLAWLVAAISSKAMNSDEIAKGVKSAEGKLQEQKLELGEAESAGLSNKSMDDILTKLKPGEAKICLVPGHAVLIAKDRSGQITLMDNGFFGKSAWPMVAQGSLLYKEALEKHGVNYIGFNVKKSCGEAVADIAQALRLHEDKIDPKETAKNLNCIFGGKKYGPTNSSIEVKLPNEVVAPIENSVPDIAKMVKSKDIMALHGLEISAAKGPTDNGLARDAEALTEFVATR